MGNKPSRTTPPCRCACCSRCCRPKTSTTIAPTPVPPTSIPPTPILPRPSSSRVFKFTDYEPAAMPDIYRDKADYQDLLDIEPLVRSIIMAQLSSQTASSNKKNLIKEPLENKWTESYMTHGELSDVITEVNSDTHGCIKSVESQEINIGAEKFQQITVQIEKLIANQLQLISQREQAIIQKHRQESTNAVNRIITKGRSYQRANEKEHQRLIEEYVVQLEKALVTHLDHLQKAVEVDQRSIISQSQQYVGDCALDALRARQNILNNAFFSANKMITDILSQHDVEFWDIKKQPVGREELRTIDLRIYSTVGENQHGLVCDKISDRNKFIKTINDTKSQNIPKRTVYLKSDPSITIPRT
ncbi:unnamed protein product [Adineta steineri]|uniref:Uncharacterized protein n=1 Tax=Adineta steineri TaxID=433720 RepID=A0A819BI59_9BILA|nr:unnamed protein product [Adineta steineri]